MTWIDGLVQHAEQQLDEDLRFRLWRRGMTDEQIDFYHVGYLDEMPEGLPPGFARWAEKHRLNRVWVFPLTNSVGQVKGIQFRPIVRKGYMDYLLEGDEAVLFGLHQAMPHIWQSNRIWLVEGVFDLCPVQRTYPEVVATLKAGISPDLLRILHRMVDQVWIGYDNDETGRKVAYAFRRDHQDEFERIEVALPPAVPMAAPEGESKLSKDWGDLWEAWGDERFGVFMEGLDPNLVV